ncbi:hypothetical protein [Seohaeicola zhoushanensis]|uniref:Uncharacterized protein n=1 Tax=Seohaeicola zhoushanensis TaxID=1569283 RepID=A0A8J3H294_9RHOB|nr:hypothetical protein [Seohaeicola zhoushanensis]GHF68253.1 hypothetical protein GCM10017056_44230 [Seohaeicola zhoushanensis]
MDDEILAVIEASVIRRWIGLAMLAGLGGVTIYVALAKPPEPVWQVFLIGIGLLSLWAAARMYAATQLRIELTREVLRDSAGMVLARVEDIRSIERGAMAFKPSNGFLVTTNTPAGRAWRPGLWWRVGRRVGVGGVVPGHQAKLVSDILSALLLERNEKGAE